MSLITKVKVGNITNLSEARYCAGMGVDYLGFPVDRNKLPVETFKEITSWVSVPQFVLELENKMYTQDQINQILHNYGIPCFECFPDHLKLLSKLDSKPLIILSFNTEDWPVVSKQIQNLKDNVIAVHLLPTSKRWDQLEEIAQSFYVLLDHEIYVETKSKNKDRIGIALSGNEEIKPGLKDYEHLADVLEALEVD